MNFKNLTKFAAAALLFASIPTFAMELQSPLKINISVHNNTDYNFKVRQPNTRKEFIVGAHQHTGPKELPFQATGKQLLANLGTHFVFTELSKESNPAEITARIFLVFEKNHELNGSASLKFDDKILQELLVNALDAPNNEINLLVTLEGNQESKFKGSTIELDISSEIR